MKRLKSPVSILAAIAVVVSGLAFSASADTESQVTTLHITKYQIAQQNGETDKIGTSDTVTGKELTTAPEGASPLSGVEFTVYRLGDMGTTVTDEQLTEIDNSYNSETKKITYGGSEIAGTSKTTDENGKADFTVEKEARGLYFVKETSAPAIVTAKAQSFTVNLPMTNESGYVYDVYAYPKNYTTLGAGVLKLTNSYSNPLVGAKFALYSKSDDTQVTSDYYGNAIGDSENHYLTTDANGYIYVNNLTVGTYYFLQKAASTGYLTAVDKYEFSVTAGKSTEVTKDTDGNLSYNNDLTLLAAQNSVKPEIKTYVTEQGTKQDSVSFGELIRFYAVADVPTELAEYKITLKMSEKLKFFNGLTVSVSANGQYSYTNLAADDYTASAVNDDNEFTVTVTNLDALTGMKKLQVMYKTSLVEATTVMGEEISANATLTYKTTASSTAETVTDDNASTVYTGGYKFKRVAVDGTTPLAGSKFKVYTADHDIEICTLTSAADGTFEAKGLTSKDYYLVEIEAPAGHSVKAARINFTVSKTSYDNEEPMIISSDPAPKLPLTGGVGAPLLAILGCAFLSLSGVGFAMLKKSEKSTAKR